MNKLELKLITKEMVEHLEAKQQEENVDMFNSFVDFLKINNLNDTMTFGDLEVVLNECHQFFKGFKFHLFSQYLCQYLLVSLGHDYDDNATFSNLKNVMIKDYVHPVERDNITTTGKIS